MDDQCQFHRDTLGVRSTSKKTKSNDDRNGGQHFEIISIDLIDEITVTAGPIPAMTIGIDEIIVVTTAATTDAMTTVAMTAPTSVPEVIIVMIAMMIVTTTDEMIDAARTTTMARKATERSGCRHHRP
jgi:hypothetical protein